LAALIHEYVGINALRNPPGQPAASLEETRQSKQADF
jgi:hypothetical protein